MPQLLATLGVIGQSFEDGVEVPRLLSGCDRGAIELGKGFWKVGEAVRQRVAFHDFGAHSHNDALDARVLGLLADGRQRLLDRQGGMHERGDLAGDQREIGCPECSANREGLLTAGFLLGDLGDAQRQQVALAQLLADSLGRVALDDALLLLSPRVNRGVFECPHGCG